MSTDKGNGHEHLHILIDDAMLSYSDVDPAGFLLSLLCYS